MHVFLVSLLACVVLILTMRKFANCLCMMDHPDERKQHAHPIPTVGGMAMFAAVLLALQFGPAIPRYQIVLLGCAAALVLLGFLDDKHNLSIRFRLLTQVTLALTVITGAHSVISQLGTVFGLPIHLGLFALPFSLLAFVGAINAMNMIDGADGMAGSMALITTVGAAIIFSASPLHMSLDLPLALIGVLSGFLLFNSRIFIRRAWVFMGDAGSMWLGLAVAWLLAQISQGESDPWVSLWLFGLPLIDTLTVIFRRMHRKKSPFVADRTHIHHVLERRGFSTGRAVLLAALGQALLVTIGVVFYLIAAPTLAVLGSFLVMFAAYYYLLRNQH
jgi:UDP-GlcNAc:undecaprenyl-phosphate GlcNAc-1-phosphate transferase